MADTETFASHEAFLFGDPPDFFDDFAGPTSVDTPLRPPLLAFKANLSSAIRVGNIPHQLTHSSILQQRFNQLLTAERIRCLKRPKPPPEDSLNEEEEKRAFLTASEKMETELRDHDVIRLHAKQTLRVLDEHLADGDFHASAKELLRQVLVMAWGAFEILVNDTLRVLLNVQPSIIKSLADSKPYRDLLSSRTLLDALEEKGFDLSSTVGDLFCDVVKIDSLEKIRDVIQLSLADPSVDVALKDERLWRISQQRHLIVHRRGLVDARYLARTGDRAPIGGPLDLTASYVETSLVVVRDVGCTVFNAAQNRLAGASKGDA